MSEILLRADDGRVRTLTLNRPDKRNALNDELITALKQALVDADADESVRVVLLRGAGKDFCSGADLASLQKIAGSSFEENLEDARSLGELYKLIRRCRVPVIAAVHGRALAGGCGLAMACDLIVSDADARFGFPEVKIGFVPAMVAAIVSRNMHERGAFAALTLGQELSAVELKRIGLIHHIFSGEELDQGCFDLAKQYESLSGRAVQMTKRLLYDLEGSSFDDAIEQGAQMNARARMTEDCKAGIARFLKK